MLKGQKVVLRDKRISDAINDYAWRCDDELARLDAVVPLRLSFSEFMSSYRWELEHLKQQRRRFGIETFDSRHIGNCMYYNMDGEKGQVELGIMIGDRAYWDQGYGSDAVATLVSHIFKETQLERIYLCTLDWNVRAQRCFQKCGFLACGHLVRQGDNFIIMELRRDWLRDKPTLATAQDKTSLYETA